MYKISTSMSFYLKPPRGTINLNLMELCVQERLDCFSKLIAKDEFSTCESYEFLQQDSILDRTSHLIFRLVAYKDANFRKIFIDNEVKLFEKRLKTSSRKEVRYFLRNSLRQLGDLSKNHVRSKLRSFYETLEHVLAKMLLPKYDQHAFEKSTNCNDCHIKVPFQLCIDLVASRNVELKDGFVQVNCQNRDLILASLFRSHLKLSIEEMTKNSHVRYALNDERIIICVKMVLKEYFDTPKQNIEGEPKLCLRDVEKNSKYFPMCMRNLYEELKEQHRLPHNDRFNLSLFLKDIGLNLDDSIKFWQEEYSKNSTSCFCSHDWEKNEKRYIYGIRHLYGLEGGRKNYSARSCSYFQEQSPDVNSKGGCPFVYHDEENLRKTLKRNLGQENCDNIEIIIYEKKDNPSFACKLYCDTIMTGKKIENANNFQTPLQYYLSFL